MMLWLHLLKNKFRHIKILMNLFEKITIPELGSTKAKAVCTLPRGTKGKLLQAILGSKKANT
jgi:hypothetical protein